MVSLVDRVNAGAAHLEAQGSTPIRVELSQPDFDLALAEWRTNNPGLQSAKFDTLCGLPFIVAANLTLSAVVGSVPGHPGRISVAI